MVLGFSNNKKTSNWNSYFILAEYDLGNGTSKSKDLNIPSVLNVPNHLQYLVYFQPKPKILILKPLETN